MYVSTALLKAVVQAPIKDKGFQIPLPSAKEANLAASHMLEWLGSHPAQVESFVDPHTSSLVGCLEGGSLASKSKRDKMWGE